MPEGGDALARCDRQLGILRSRFFGMNELIFMMRSIALLRCKIFS